MRQVIEELHELSVILLNLKEIRKAGSQQEKSLDTLEASIKAKMHKMADNI